MAQTVDLVECGSIKLEIDTKTDRSNHPTDNMQTTTIPVSYL